MATIHTHLSASIPAASKSSSEARKEAMGKTGGLDSCHPEMPAGIDRGVRACG